MRGAMRGYYNDLNSVNLSDCSVCSAKYLAFNLSHPSFTIVTDWCANEYSKHLQGNIIFSVGAELFKHSGVKKITVRNYVGVELSSH